MTAYDGSTATALQVGLSVEQAMHMHGRSALPNEACGVLFGRYDEDGVAVVEGCARLANVSEDPAHTYRFDEGQQAEVWDAVRARGLEVLAVWHTHPSGPQGPSQSDLAYMQPWLLYPILSADPEHPEHEARLAVYRLTNGGEGGYEEVPVRLQLLPLRPAL
jgi:proteasome lid subunit RPN8/RPN11